MRLSIGHHITVFAYCRQLRCCGIFETKPEIGNIGAGYTPAPSRQWLVILRREYAVKILVRTTSNNAIFLDAQLPVRLHANSN
jgi:hypothetical protein